MAGSNLYRFFLIMLIANVKSVSRPILRRSVLSFAMFRKLGAIFSSLGHSYVYFTRRHLISLNESKIKFSGLYISRHGYQRPYYYRAFRRDPFRLKFHTPETGYISMSLPQLFNKR